MKGILVTSENCGPCQEMKEQFREQIISGEIEVKSLEEDEAEVLILMQKHGAGIPCLLILSDNGSVLVNSSAE